MLKIDDIAELVADRLGSTVDEMRGKSKQPIPSLARHVAIYLTRRMTRITHREAAGWFGGRSHPASIRACERVEDEMSVDMNFCRQVETMERDLDRIQRVRRAGGYHSANAPAISYAEARSRAARFGIAA